MPPTSVLLEALWLGLLTAILPCVLTQNVTAVSYLAARVSRPRQSLLSGAFYIAGRAAAYVAIAALCIGTAISIPQVSVFLQRYLNTAAGPILILAGMVILELIPLRLPGPRVSESLQGRVGRGSLVAAGLLGLLLALCFCPPVAAMFFGGLIPLAIEHRSPLLLPLAFALGTALPASLLAVLIVLGVKWLAVALDRLRQFERWARRATGLVFILVGIYLCLVYIFGIFEVS